MTSRIRATSHTSRTLWLSRVPMRVTADLRNRASSIVGRVHSSVCQKLVASQSRRDDYSLEA